MVGALAGVAGVFGSLIGSFLNVVIFRLPAGRSIVAPPSACGSCGARIRPWDNVPVVSWLLLRGRCRDCAAGISVRYPLVELGTALFFGVVAWWLLSGVVSTSSSTGSATAGVAATLVAFLYLAAVSVALAMIDLDTHTLPNRIVLPAYPVAAVLLTGGALLAGTPERLLTALAGGAALFGLYLLLALIYPGGMGLGDVKLAGLLGLYLGWLGWAPLAVGAFSAFLLGGVFSLVLVITRRANRKSGIPFGPWMLAGAWLGIFGGETIATWYLSLFGLA
ncbi:leader peptidase (prepilin peptidase) / N-methyltransferase [Cryobacterium psychrotolerans]|uniref:Prepilin leader peptidase/N-methyltransferase n=1 Tax=Cryobacterium psychrotolerans TaxID=386301 RepID=A0A1G9APK3_9MICO|nr:MULTISPECIES: A24 family peptidase [Cryobacterium]TFD42722.1 prepilin peptidase [Cryobacterium sp. TMT1-2-1]TFD89577.1 prepilin peptidase [Cryobacterium psychrotolerans]SDK29173.1 leader peptidase (prepilin peptidase) / N-methyltransferase [Cryobacterium psychrotolerans]